MKDALKITRKQFDTYIEVRDKGQYNMIDKGAIDASGLDFDIYMTIVRNFSTLMKSFETDIMEFVLCKKLIE